jgi:hypothetical protein
MLKNRFSKRFIVLVLAATSCYTGIAGAQSTDIDLKGADNHFALSGGLNLHAREQFPDGAKGYETYSPTRGSMPDAALNPKYKTRAELLAHGIYCGADAIVLAKFLDASPCLAATKKTIYTYAHFSVIDVIKSSNQAAVAPGQKIVKYRLGGEVMDGGEKLRVEVSDAPAYISGDDYILLLRRENATQNEQYSVPDHTTSLVKNERVYTGRSQFAGLPEGTAYTDVVSELRAVAPLGCP